VEAGGTPWYFNRRLRTKFDGDEMSTHTCSYYCDRPECIKAQRDELREAIEKRKWTHLTDEEFDQVLKEFSHDPRAMAIELEIRIMEKNTCIP